MASGEDPNAWLGLLKWSLSHQDGTAPSEARPMGDEVRISIQHRCSLVVFELRPRTPSRTCRYRLRGDQSSGMEGQGRKSLLVTVFSKGLTSLKATARGVILLVDS